MECSFIFCLFCGGSDFSVKTWKTEYKSVLVCTRCNNESSVENITIGTGQSFDSYELTNALEQASFPGKTAGKIAPWKVIDTIKASTVEEEVDNIDHTDIITFIDGLSCENHAKSNITVTKSFAEVSTIFIKSCCKDAKKKIAEDIKNYLYNNELSDKYLFTIK